MPSSAQSYGTEGRREMTTRDLARRIRAHALRMTHLSNASHIGSCLSMADLLAVLYGQALRIDPAQPRDALRDRFILSKGHGAAILYAVLAECGFFSLSQLDTYCQDGSSLIGHVNHHVPGVELSTGSLGHGLPVGCGMALAAHREGNPQRVFVLLSDGELDEGSNWEAILFAPHHHLDNLIAIVDYNKIQSFGSVEEVLNLHPLADKFRAFQWGVREIDGHDHTQISHALTELPAEPGKPTAIIAHTIKGKGVSFMENQLKWHYSSPNADQLAVALAELERTR
jgi:transketolase